MTYPTAEELEDLIQARRAITNPPGRSFPDPIKNRLISVSAIVKKTAENYAKQLLGQDTSDIPAYFGFRGNALADAALTPITPHRECVANWNDDALSSWHWSGHPDGISVAPSGTLVVDEGKSHFYVTLETDKEIEQAYRQGCLYAAIIKHLPPGHVLPLADYVEDPLAEPFQIPPALAPGAYVIVDNMGAHDAIHAGWHVKDSELEEVLDHYRRKALVVLKAVEARDAGIAAREWDLTPDGILEAWKPLQEPPVIEDEEAQRAASEWREAKEQSKAAKKIVEGKQEAQLKAILANRGLVSEDEKKVSARIGEYRVEARWPSLTHLSIK